MSGKAPIDGSLPSSFRGWKLFLCGICMGAADLIPGISGGTVAFILGFYQPLLESLKTLNWTTFKLLLRGEFSSFFAQVEWKFLATLAAGILCAFFTLSNFFHFLLSHDVYRIYLMATFVGLILASFVFCVRQITVWNAGTLLLICLGATIAFFLTGSTTSPPADFINPTFTGWLVLCGALAICALLLPGISGSYILTLLGVYPLAIKALADFTKGLTHLSFNGEAFAVLAGLGVGIVIGAIVFARVVSWFLRHYPTVSLALLSGFMIGAIRSVWPFGFTQAHLPSLLTPLTWYALAFMFAGFLFVMIIETYTQRKKVCV